MDEALRILQAALAAAAQLEALLPQLSANYALVKDALSSDDKAKIQRMIDDLHARTNNATAELVTYRDPA